MNAFRVPLKKMAIHLARQRARSGGASCRYRAHDGQNRCPVGVLINDSAYSNVVEGYGIEVIELSAQPSNRDPIAEDCRAVMASVLSEFSPDADRRQVVSVLREIQSYHDSNHARPSKLGAFYLRDIEVFANKTDMQFAWHIYRMFLGYVKVVQGAAQ